MEGEEISVVMTNIRTISTEEGYKNEIIRRDEMDGETSVCVADLLNTRAHTHIVCMKYEHTDRIFYT